MRRTIRLSARSLALAAVLAVVLPLALAAPSQAGDRLYPAGAGLTDPVDQVVAHENGPPLANASIVRVQGRPTGDGGCTFPVPELKLAPDESAIEARQIETNFTNCTAEVEIGTPLIEDETPEGGTFDSDVSVPAGAAKAGDAQIAATSSSGYYRVYWEDVINLRVHEVKSNISWVWDGTCVTASSGSADYWWLSGTGWLKHSSGSWITRQCASSLVYTDATYKNGAFCWPGTVWSYYDDVRVRGRADGWLLGAVVGTWTTYPFLCPTLHYHTELRRVTG